MYERKWTDEKIEEWFLESFPNVSLNAQLLKLEEECKEMLSSSSLAEAQEELADIYIVLLGLKTLDSCVGIFFSTLFNQAGTLADPLKDILFKKVDEKMDKNSKRTWKQTSEGLYRHIEKE